VFLADRPIGNWQSAIENEKSRAKQRGTSINARSFWFVLSNRSELFSRLFYVAASRLNSPRFPFVLIRLPLYECQAGGEMSKVWFRLAGWMAKVDRGMQALLHFGYAV